MVWPDNEIIVPKTLHWLAKEVDVYATADWIRGDLPGLGLPLPLCPVILDSIDTPLDPVCQAHHLITGVNNCKKEQHPQRLRETRDITFYDRMWWLRELFRVLGGVQVQFHAGS
jgi:hypothetical protein